MFDSNEIEPSPVIPINDMNNPNFPRALIHNHVDVQHHPSTLLPPSTSDFLGPNNFPSLQSLHIISHGHNGSRPHTLPSHYPYHYVTD